MTFFILVIQYRDEPNGVRALVNYGGGDFTVYDHPRAVVSERLSDVCCNADGIAHVVQAIEGGDKVVLTTVVLRGPRHLETDLGGHAGGSRALACLVDRRFVATKD